MSALISASVGKGGANVAADVRAVQRLLNDSLSRSGQAPLLAVDGVAGPKTNAAILAFQRNRGSVSDGRFDPNGPGLRKLFDEHISGLHAMIDVSRLNVMFNRTAPGISSSDFTLSAVIDTYVKALRES